MSLVDISSGDGAREGPEAPTGMNSTRSQRFWRWRFVFVFVLFQWSTKEGSRTVLYFESNHERTREGGLDVER